MGVDTKTFRYAVTLEDRGRMLAEGRGGLELDEAWSPDHLLVAALLRCTLESLEYHAERAGLTMSGRGDGVATVTKRDADDRYAVVELVADLEAAVEPDPGDAEVAELLAKAERDCFVGASLAAAPTYNWVVNGREVRPAAPS